MIQKKFIISIIFIILKIQNNVMVGNSLGIQKVATHVPGVETDVPGVETDVPGVETDVPSTENHKEYHSKMNYNKLLSTNKYYLIMFSNILYITLNIIFIFSYLNNQHISEILFLPFCILNFILPIIITIIFLYDFNKYKKAKNSNDINQYNKYIIDDNNINQLIKQRRYNFINGLSISVSFICTLLIFIKENFFSKIIKNIIKLFKNDFENIRDLFAQIIFIITFILQIIYIILLIIDNKNNIWNSVKNSIHKQDILFHIGYLLFIFIGYIGLYYLNHFLYAKEKLAKQKLKS